jgi:hypothetical protein
MIYENRDDLKRWKTVFGLQPEDGREVPARERR